MKAQRKVRGFTLIEVMIVVAIIAVIVGVALPSYQDQIRKTNRNLVKAELMSILARQEQFFVNNKQYATTLTDLGYSASPYGMNRDSEEVAVTATDRIYNVQITGASATAFTLQAIPQLSQTKDTRCGTLAITSLGVKSETGTGSTSDCW